MKEKAKNKKIIKEKEEEMEEILEKEILPLEHHKVYNLDNEKAKLN